MKIMKSLFVVMSLFALMPFALAADVDIMEIRGYVDNERQTGVDEDGGNFFVSPGDIVDIIIELENNENKTAEAKIKATVQDIDSGDDIIKEQNYFEIDPNDERSKMISFTVPVGTTTDDYRLDLKVTYREKDTSDETVIETDFQIAVRKNNQIDEEELLRTSLINMTNSCSDLSTGLDTCFGYIKNYNNVSDELSSVKEERGKFKEERDNAQESLQVCQNEKVNLERDKQMCDNQKINLVTKEDAEAEKALAVKEANKSKDTFYLMIIGLGVGFYFYQKKKKEKISVEETYYYDKQ